jgi:hypothetical protein
MFPLEQAISQLQKNSVDLMFQKEPAFLATPGLPRVYRNHTDHDPNRVIIDEKLSKHFPGINENKTRRLSAKLLQLNVHRLKFAGEGARSIKTETGSKKEKGRFF